MTTTTITFINAPDPDRLYRAWAEIETRNGEPGHNGATAGNSTASPCIAEQRHRWQCVAKHSYGEVKSYTEGQWQSRVHRGAEQWQSEAKFCHGSKAQAGRGKAAWATKCDGRSLTALYWQSED